MALIERIKEGWKEFWQKDRRIKLFTVGFIGTVMLLLGGWELLSFFEIDPFTDYEPPLLIKIEEWGWALVIIGGILMIFGFLYYHDYNKSFKRFEELMGTESRANFVKNLDEIEQLALELGPEFERRVMEKRERYRVKTR
jgi:hypothetical protein